MAQNVGVNVHHAQFTPLNTDFGHDALGSLGGRRVQQVQPQAPRSLGQALSDLGGRIRQLANRVLDAITPHGVRAERKFRIGLEATSRQVGELLGALAKTQRHPVDGARAQSLIDTMARTAEPVTSRGADLTDLMRQRLTVNVSRMSTDELVAVQQGVADARNGPLGANQRSGAYLTLIDGAVGRELAQRLQQQAEQVLKPLIEQGQLTLPDPDAPVQYQSGAVPEAARVLREHGLAGTTEQALGLIRDVMGKLVEDGSLDLQRTGDMLIALPSDMQRALLDTNVRVLAQDPNTIDRLLSGAVGLKAERLEQQFMQSAARLLDHPESVIDDINGPLRNPGGYAQEVVALAKNVADMQSHRDIHDLNLGEGVEDRLAEVRIHLRARLTPDNMLPGELNNRQLRDLQQAVQTLGELTLAAETIADEVARRKSAALAEYGDAMQGVLQAAAGGNLAGLLRGLDEVRSVGNRTIDVHQRLGEDLEGGDKLMAFRERLLLEALENADSEQLLRVLAQIEGPTGQTLIDGLSSAGSRHLSRAGGDPALGRQLFDTSSDLQLLATCVRHELSGRNVPLPAPPEAEPPALDRLGEQELGILRDVLGIAVHDGGRVTRQRGELPAESQQRFGQFVADFRNTPLDNHLVDGFPSGVSQALWLDLPRASYTLDNGRGGSTPVVDQTGFNFLAKGEQDQRVLAGVQRLREFCGDDVELLQKMSVVVNQNLLAGLQMIEMSGDSPIRLPDGTPGRLVGAGHPSYHLRSDGDGGLLVQVTYETTDATHFMDVRGGNMIELDPAGSHSRFTFELQIDAGGELSVSEPIRFEYDLRLKQD